MMLDYRVVMLSDGNATNTDAEHAACLSFRARAKRQPAIHNHGCRAGYLRRITALSSQEMARYISEETIARMVIAVITMFILKIWLP